MRRNRVQVRRNQLERQLRPALAHAQNRDPAQSLVFQTLCGFSFNCAFIRRQQYTINDQDVIRCESAITNCSRHGYRVCHYQSREKPAVHPPSTTKTWPVTYLASSEAR